MQRQPTRGQNAWQDPSTAQPGFGAYRSGGQPSQQQPASQPTPQPSQPNMSAYGPSFRRDETVYSPFGNFQNLGQYQQHQDAFVQQFLQGQNQYNQALNSGQQASPVNLGQAWQQAGENIANGTYQGNPFATGNVQGLMGMFDMYGIQAPAGFQDQLIAQIGQQAPPSMYSPTPRPPMTSYPIGPNGEYYPGFGVGPQQPMQMAPGYGARILNPGGTFTAEYRDRDGDGVEDSVQPGPGMPPVQRPQSGPTGPQGEYYPGGPMTPFVRQPSPARSPVSERRIDPTPSSPDLVRRVEEDAARDRRLRQEAEMQERYPWLDPVRRSPGGKVTGWQPNQQRVAEAERAREQKLQDQGYIIGAIKPDGEKVWISPQQQAARQQQAESLRQPAPASVQSEGPAGFRVPGSRQAFNQYAREEKARNTAAARKGRREQIGAARPAAKPPGQASPTPEASSGTPYVPPSQRTGPTGDEEYDSWFRRLTRPARRR